MRSVARSRLWVVAALLGAVVLLVGSARPWLHARTEDAVVGAASITLTGSDLSPAVPAAALLAGAALLVGLVGSPVVRRLGGACLVLASLVAGVPVVGALRDPAGAAAPALQDRTAITGGGEAARQVQADPTWVVSLALVAVLALLAAGVLRLLPQGGGTRPGAAGGNGRDEPEGHREARPAGEAGAGYGSDTWERLSAGEDPTQDEPGDDDTGRDLA